MIYGIKRLLEAWRATVSSMAVTLSSLNLVLKRRIWQNQS